MLASRLAYLVASSRQEFRGDRIDESSERDNARDLIW
jgi:hypothetical protein